MATSAFASALNARGRIDAKAAQLFWAEFFASAEYRENLKQRILAGEAAHMEVLLHHLAYGKPKETLALQGEGDGIFILKIGDREVSAQITEGGMVQALPGPVPGQPPRDARLASAEESILRPR